MAGVAGLKNPLAAVVGVIVAILMMVVVVGVRYPQLRRAQQTSFMTLGPWGISMSEMRGGGAQCRVVTAASDRARQTSRGSAARSTVRT